ncbi:MAG: M81 family metallopeptidase [Candidatus Hydrogenedentes bacterium]|nr:M81 family metallopeptidase [Candidatus Hydrogenedentota bacterium]
MRIAIAGFLHESNTFTEEKTNLRHFEEAFLHYGPDLIPAWRDAHHELGGFIAGCEAEGAELVPLLAAWATPMGPLTRDTYETIVQGLLDRLAAALPFDGLLLALHGAMVSDNLDSADSETLRRIRSVIGDIPLVLSLDMHGNVTEDMVRLPNATIAYRTYPHVDQRARGIDCAQILARTIRGEVHPVQAMVKLPMLIHIVQQYTGAGAMAHLMAEVEATASRPGILSASLAPGYIYADVPHMGVSVIVVADGDAALAQREADRLAALVFERRHELNAALPDVPTAVAQAMDTPGTVCLMDCGDNIGAGGPGDATTILAELLRQGMPRICAVLYDPEAAEICLVAGQGAPVSIEVGAKTDTQHGAPIPIAGVVQTLADGIFSETEARHGGMSRLDQGSTAVIHTDDGHTIVLNSRRIMPTSLQQLLSLGIDPRAHRAIIVKGVTAPRAAYDPIADAVITVDSPGVTQAGPEAFPYRKRPRPLFPLDE